MISFSDLIQFGIFVIALITLITKVLGNKK